MSVDPSLAEQLAEAEASRAAATVALGEATLAWRLAVRAGDDRAALAASGRCLFQSAIDGLDAEIAELRARLWEQP